MLFCISRNAEGGGAGTVAAMMRGEALVSGSGILKYSLPFSPTAVGSKSSALFATVLDSALKTEDVECQKYIGAVSLCGNGPRHLSHRARYGLMR